MSVTILTGFSYSLIGIAVLWILSFPPLPLPQLLLVTASGILLVLYLIPYFKALAIDDASRVVPLFQVVPVMVLILSFIFLNEKLSWEQFFGFLLIVFGGFILGSEKIENGIFKTRKSFWYMMISSMLYASIGVLFKIASYEGNFWITLAYQTIGAGIGSIFLLLVKKYRTEFIKQVKNISLKTWGVLSLNEICNALANIAYAYAITLAPIALVTVAGGVQPVFLLVGGVFLSRLFPQFIKEDISRSVLGIKFICVLFIFAGLYLIYL